MQKPASIPSSIKARKASWIHRTQRSGAHWHRPSSRDRGPGACNADLLPAWGRGHLRGRARATRRGPGCRPATMMRPAMALIRFLMAVAPGLDPGEVFGEPKFAVRPV
jgi:hypothetical protein